MCGWHFIFNLEWEVSTNSLTFLALFVASLNCCQVTNMSLVHWLMCLTVNLQAWVEIPAQAVGVQPHPAVHPCLQDG